MKVPRRLVEESSLFASLVADAERREPPPEALRGLLRRLESPPAVATGSASASRRKWALTAIAGAGGVVLLGAFTAELLSRNEPLPVVPPETSAPAAEHAAPAPSIPSAASEPANAVPSVSIDELPDSKVAAPRPRSPAAAPASPSAVPSSRREIELVAQAREALTRGDARACLAAVDLHDREFPDGQFALEANVMRIEATLAKGDRAGARALALEYLARNPGSAYEGRVRSLAAAATEDR
ncbi:MAG: hypothetical protein KF764_31200 [Labilithrix sp.]|nr:hypothetical protein [Labilithrix sp.]